MEEAFISSEQPRVPYHNLWSKYQLKATENVDCFYLHNKCDLAHKSSKFGEPKQKVSYNLMSFTSMLVSVIIPTYNSVHSKKTLPAILQQKTGRFEFEII